jgi:anti-sigma B factor antagonist
MTGPRVGDRGQPFAAPYLCEDAPVTTRDEPDPLTDEFEPFRIDVELETDAARVAPVGELDLATVDKLRAEVDRQRESGLARLVLDLRGVRFLDSTGLRFVLELDSAAKANGQELALIRGPEVVHRIFEVTQVVERLRFVDP